MRAFSASVIGARKRARSLRMEFMRPVARMARSLFPDDSEIRRALAMPKAKDYERLITAAQAMADHAEVHKVRFVEAGFDDGFVDSLRKGADDLRTALDEKGAHFGKRAAATAGLIEELSRCKDLLRLLDDMVSPGLQATPDRLAEWRALSRFVRIKRETEEGTTLPPTGAPNVSAPVTGIPPSATTTVPSVATSLLSSATEDVATVARAA